MKLDSLLETLSTHPAIDHLLKRVGHFVVEDPLTLSLSIATAFQKEPKRIAVIAPNLYRAQTLYEQLVSFLGEDQCYFYPVDEVIRLDTVSSSKEMLSQRLFVMQKALEQKPAILITHLTSALRYMPQPSLFQERCVHVEVGMRLSMQTLKEQLESMQYTRVSKIDQSLQYAARGDILDVFPINEERPLRIEFFDDEVESIRPFTIENQRSEGSLSQCLLFPSSDLLLTPSAYEQGKSALQAQFDKEGKQHPQQEELKKRFEQTIAQIESRGFDENTYRYYAYFLPHPASIFDYFQPELTVVDQKEKCENAYSFALETVQTYFEEAAKNGLSLLDVRYYQSYETVLATIQSPYFTYSTSIEQDAFTLPLRSVPFAAGSILKSTDIIERYQQEGKKVILCLSSLQQDTMRDFLKEKAIVWEEVLPQQIPVGMLGITSLSLQEGIELYESGIVYLTARELFGYRHRSTRFSSRYKHSIILQSFEELEPGDYVVHEESGIGRFEEITTLEIQDSLKDYLKIQYAGTGVLYIPLEQFHLIRKYVSREGAVPKLNHLGGKEWDATKKRIKARVQDIAERLIALYAERQAVPGFAFEQDDALQYEFENAFPFPLTSDQRKAIEEIKTDMQKPIPMDRLLCGDVGFGKTEVAFRAAFKAMLSHKQVAILCPTTILARQHYEVAFERFTPFGIKIALFSRFVTEKEQKAAIEKVKTGEISLVIGTHRLLSKEIQIPALGLLIVDEEQRFGVEHKERIKEMAHQVDVLTLTATPIPRTLQMSLLGIRNLSQLQTPPMNRIPIQTYVIPYQETLIQQVIERELAREGQVFYLHNRVTSIYTTARRLQQKIPNSRVGVVHGQMEREAMEEIMDQYYRGEINVLVCTSIIETGLDIANANTMIIEQADRFGLSQLYQIKGRVGRSTRVAYAYLLFDPRKEMNEIAAKRLKAIKDFTELGSGYKIAQRDLTIRGAGDILGAEQSGFIDTIGVDLYMKILQEVLEERKGNQPKKILKRAKLLFDGYIPSTYAEDKDKIQLYQELEDADSLVKLEVLRRKMRDMYGRLPKEVELLLRKRKIDILSNTPLIESIEETDRVVITLQKEASAIPRIAQRLEEQLFPLRRFLHVLLKEGVLILKIVKGPQLMEHVERVVEVLHTLT